METNNKKGACIEILIASLLTFCGGFCDGYTLLFRGGIFSNMQTGNLVKFVIALSNGCFELIYFLPIVVFCLGVLIAIEVNKNKDRSIVILIAMTIVFIGSGFLPNTDISNIICVSILSITGAMQYQTFRKCKEVYYSSTMCTNNMRLMSEGILKFIDNKKDKRFLFFILIIVVFSLGVLVSTLLGKVFSYYTISFLSIISSIVVVLRLIIKEKETETSVENAPQMQNN